MHQAVDSSSSDGNQAAIALLQPDSYTLPSLGTRHRANSLRVRTCVVDWPVTAPFKALVDREIEKLWRERWINTGVATAQSIFDTVGEGDIHFSLTIGYEDQAVKTYLLKEMVSQPKASAVQGDLQGFRADYMHLQVYDLGVELIAHDLVLIRPSKDGKAFVIRLEYVES